MKKLTFVFAALAVALTASSVSAQDTREDWLDKGFAFGLGVGNNVVRGHDWSTAGLSLRMYPIEVFGLELVLSGGRDKVSVTTPAQPPATPETKNFVRTSHFDMSLLGDFRFLRSNRSALSAYAGFGLAMIGAAQTFPSTVVPNAVVTGKDSVVDFAVELGLRGEIFLYEFFSVNGRVGININPHTDNEEPNPTHPETPEVENPFAPETGGANVSVFDGDVFGHFGFTLWFN